MKSVRPCVLLRLSVVVSLVLSMLVLHPFCAVAVDGQDIRVVEADGAGVVINGDVALARDNALADAFRKVVEQAVEMCISSDAIFENTEVIRDNIYSKSQVYIQTYTITGEKAGDSLYMVSVQAAVSLKEIDNDLQALGIITARKSMPRVMTIIAEKNAGKTGSDPVWNPAQRSIAEDVIHARFLKDGFAFVDRTSLAEVPAFQGTELDNLDALQLGSRLDAELVIAGTSLVKSSGTVAGTAMRSFQATVTARAIRTDNGVVIASTNARAEAVYMDAATGGMEAIKKASEQVADVLLSQIAATWQQEVRSSAMISVTVRGITSCSDFVRFRKMLKEDIRGVKNIYQRRMKSGEALVDVEIEGTAQSFADEMALKELKEFSLDITDVTQNSVEVVIAK